MRAYDFYSGVEFSDTYQRVNKNRTTFFHAVMCLFRDVLSSHGVESEVFTLGGASLKVPRD